MNQPKVLLLCSNRFALPCLQQLAFLNMLVAVVIPRRNVEMVENVQFLLQQNTIPIILVDKESYVDVITAAIETYQVTLGLMCTFSFLIPEKIFRLPAQGFYNVHPGPLPQYRGADPIFQQLKNREPQAGVCIHVVDRTFDTGPMVMQEMININLTDTHGLLTSKLAHVAARLLLTLLKLVSLGVEVPLKQQDSTKARYFKLHKASEVSINWQQMDGPTIIALVNACNPWNKGATAMLNGKIIRLLEVEVVPLEQPFASTVPGTILAFENQHMLVSTYNHSAIRIGTVYIEEGFLPAARLQQMGIVSNMVFQQMW